MCRRTLPRRRHEVPGHSCAYRPRSDAADVSHPGGVIIGLLCLGGAARESPHGREATAGRRDPGDPRGVAMAAPGFTRRSRPRASGSWHTVSLSSCFIGATAHEKRPGRIILNGSKCSIIESVGIRHWTIVPPPSSKRGRRALHPVSMKSGEDQTSGSYFSGGERGASISMLRGLRFRAE